MISTKARMFELLRAGVLGNHLRIWESVEAFLRDPYRGLVTVRCADAPGLPCHTHLTRRMAWRYASAFQLAGFHPVISESAPDSSLVLQGECMWLYGTFYSTTSALKLPMRQAMKYAEYRGGREAEVHLRRTIGARSWSELVFLEYIYPGHVIEFGYYSRLLGTEEKPMVIWEVRNY